METILLMFIIFWDFFLESVLKSFNHSFASELFGWTSDIVFSIVSIQNEWISYSHMTK